MIKPVSLLDLAKANNAITGQGVVLLMDNVQPPVGTESLVLWFKNIDPILNYHLSRLVISLAPNTNATTGNMFCEARLRIMTAQPTANFTVAQPITMDSSSSFLANAIFYTWNGNGSGMTAAFSGVYGGGVNLINQPFVFDFQGASVIAPGVSFGITVKTLPASSTNNVNVALNLTGYYRDDRA